MCVRSLWEVLARPLMAPAPVRGQPSRLPMRSCLGLADIGEPFGVRGISPGASGHSIEGDRGA